MPCRAPCLPVPPCARVPVCRAQDASGGATDSELRVFSVWSSPGLMAIWRKVAFTPVVLRRQCVVFPSRVHWLAYEHALSLMEELESKGAALDRVGSSGPQKSASGPPECVPLRGH